jgi:hypothetical protein
LISNEVVDILDSDGKAHVFRREEKAFRTGGWACLKSGSQATDQKSDAKHICHFPPKSQRLFRNNSHGSKRFLQIWLTSRWLCQAQKSIKFVRPLVVNILSGWPASPARPETWSGMVADSI